MPEPFDARSYDPYNTDLISDRDLPTSDRHAVYDARCTVIHEPVALASHTVLVCSHSADGMEHLALLAAGHRMGAMVARPTKSVEQRWAQAWRIYEAAGRRIRRLQRAWEVYARRRGRKRPDAAFTTQRTHVERMMATSVRWQREGLRRYRTGRM